MPAQQGHARDVRRRTRVMAGVGRHSAVRQMASIYFYATRTDLLEVLEFLFAETDVRVFEAYSRLNQTVREFGSIEDLRAQDPAAASHGKLHLRLCSPSVTSGPAFRRFELNPGVGGGYRFSVEDPSIIRIVEGGIRSDIEQEPLYWSEIANWNEAGARQRSAYSDADLDQINWQELVRLSSRIQRFIRSNLTAASFGTRPILRHAFEEMAVGLKVWRGPGCLVRGQVRFGSERPAQQAVQPDVARKRAPRVNGGVSHSWR